MVGLWDLPGNVMMMNGDTVRGRRSKTTVLKTAILLYICVRLACVYTVYNIPILYVY